MTMIAARPGRQPTAARRVSGCCPGRPGAALRIGPTMTFDNLPPGAQEAASGRSRPSLRAAIGDRLLVADGAMGSMLQGSPATLDDFAGYEGCNEILNVTRPDIVRDIHVGYLDAGVDCLTTNTFGANLGNLGEYGIAGRIDELAEAGARIAREAADQWSGERPRWVLGSMGPGTKLPTLGHVTFAELRDTYQVNAEGLLRGGADALIVETCQDLLQAKAAIIGARRAIAAAGRRHHADRPGDDRDDRAPCCSASEIGAALTALEPLGIDVIGLNCATGPGEMSEHLRYLAAHSRLPLSCMPNAGLPELTADGAYYPVTPDQLADAHEAFAAEFGLALVGGLLRHHARAPGRGGAAVAGPPARRQRGRSRSPAWPRSTSTCRSARTPRSWRSGSGPTPTGPRRSARR